MSKKFLKIAQ